MTVSLKTYKNIARIPLLEYINLRKVYHPRFLDGHPQWSWRMSSDDRRDPPQSTAPLDHYERTLAKRKLSTLIPNAQTFSKSERAAKPLNRFTHIRVRKLWDDGRWHRTVCDDNCSFFLHGSM
jgi:hypothetical protein